MDGKKIVLEPKKLCARCGELAEANYGAYIDGRQYDSCGPCAIILGESIRIATYIQNHGTVTT